MSASSVPALTVSDVSKVYRARGRDRKTVTAVDGVSFTIAPGAALSLVGASGSGKSTLAKMITGSERPTAGSITFGDVAVGRLRAGGLRRLHRQVQMVFQDPYGALNPLHTVEYTVMRLKLLAELRRQRGLSLLYITHDLLSARLVTDEILVLNSGRIVEHGPTKQVLQHPRHSYTMQLLDAVANPFAAASAGSPATGRGR